MREHFFSFILSQKFIWFYIFHIATQYQNDQPTQQRRKSLEKYNTTQAIGHNGFQLRTRRKVENQTANNSLNRCFLVSSRLYSLAYGHNIAKREKNRQKKICFFRLLNVASLWHKAYIRLNDCALAWLRLFCQNELRIYFAEIVGRFKLAAWCNASNSRKGFTRPQNCVQTSANRTRKNRANRKEYKKKKWEEEQPNRNSNIVIESIYIERTSAC